MHILPSAKKAWGFSGLSKFCGF